MAWLALDIGSSQWKAGVLSPVGKLEHVCRLPIPLDKDARSRPVVQADAVLPTLKRLLGPIPPPVRQGLRGIAVCGMAEGGLLLDAHSLQATSPLIPWFDLRGQHIHEHLASLGRLQGRFQASGLPSSPKYSLFKILSLLEESGRDSSQVRWLGVPEYIAFLLSGVMASEASLAARSYAFDILLGKWDLPFMASLGLDARLFAPVLPAGQPLGSLKDDLASLLGLPSRLPVALGGHDHLCAAQGTSALGEERLYCSAGTAQVLVRRKAGPGLEARDEQSGLSFGPLPGGGLSVLGAVQAAGASLNWIRDLLFARDGFEGMLAEAALHPQPVDLMYFPYLAGSGPPDMNPKARGGFLGLDGNSSRGHMLKAVYQGLAFESRVILEAMGPLPGHLLISGGLSAHPVYLQTLAEVLGLQVQVPACQEGTLLGAARIMAGCAGWQLPDIDLKESYSPRPEEAGRLQHLYQHSYLPLRAAQLSHYGGAGKLRS